MNDGSASFFLLMMLVVAMLALTNFLNHTAKMAREEERNERLGLRPESEIKAWHLVLIVAVVGLGCIAYTFYEDWHRKNWKGKVVVDEIREYEVRKIINNPNNGSVMVLLVKPGEKERAPTGYARRGKPDLWADFEKPCQTIDLLPIGSLVKAHFVARRYADSFPTGYYEKIEEPDSLCP